MEEDPIDRLIRMNRMIPDLLGGDIVPLKPFVRVPIQEAIAVVQVVERCEIE